jgi:hypothetical protein
LFFREKAKMKNTVQHMVPLLWLLLISSGLICSAGTLTLTGSWAKTIDSSDLQAGPGSDLTDTYESAANQVTIDVTAVGNSTWDVNVKKIDSNWHANFQLSVRRTSSGTGAGGSSVSGGTTYQEITDTNQLFFNGKKARQGINVQLRLSGVSVQIPQDTYITTVYYTVVET